MDLSPLEQHVFAHYVANGAERLEMVGRFWPYGELVLIVEDKVQFGVGKFGYKAKMVAPKVARAFLDHVIAQGGFSSVKQEFGGTMHQYQAAPYLECVKKLQASDPIIVKSQGAGESYWQDAFAAVLK